MYSSADPRLTDYDTLLQNIKDLKSGQPTQVSTSSQHCVAVCMDAVCFTWLVCQELGRQCAVIAACIQH